MFKNIFKTIIVIILTCEAKLLLFRHKPNVVAITGSVGKTSTKDSIYTVLSSEHNVRKSPKTLNTEFGVPLAILGIKNAWGNPFMWIVRLVEGAYVALFSKDYPDILVLELGADHPGDIRKLSKWVNPKTAIITRYPEVPVHVEFFENAEEVIKEKQYLPKSLPKDGTLITNGDDEIIEKCDMPEVKTHLKYGFGERNDVWASNFMLEYDNGVVSGISFQVNYNSNSGRILFGGVLGKQHVYPALAAITTGIAYGVDFNKAVKALSKHKFPLGRMRLVEGTNRTVIIDDSYNSSPVAVFEALNVLKDIETEGRKIVVLGDMLELGKYSGEEHRKVGRHAACVANLMVTVGEMSEQTADSAQRSKIEKENVYEYEDSGAAGKDLREILEPGDVILIKGSQSMRMERAVEQLMAHPEEKEEVLVRQERVWRYR